MEELSYERFAGVLHSSFAVTGEGIYATALELVVTSTLPGSPRIEAFALELRGPAEYVLPQAIYHFEHTAMGSFDLFIVPIRQDGSGTFYEANFNRLRTEG